MSSRKSGKSYTRDIRGLRDALFDEIEDLREGASSPHEAVAFCSLSEQVLETFNASIKQHAYMLAVEEKKLAMENCRLSIKERSLRIENACQAEEGESYEETQSQNMQVVRIAHRRRTPANF
jgi:hypothetical protein